MENVPPATPIGPFGTEREARLAALAAVGADLAYLRLTPEQNMRLLEGACTAAAVEVGPYDARCLAWLANYEAALCASVAGLIHRAATHRGGWASGSCA